MRVCCKVGQGSVVNNLTGTLQNHDGDWQQECHKTGFNAQQNNDLYVCYTFLYISFLFSAKQHEMTKFKVLWRMRT